MSKGSPELRSLWELGKAEHVYVHIHANTFGNVCGGVIKYPCMCICDSMVNMYKHVQVCAYVQVSAHVYRGSESSEQRPLISGSAETFL